MKKEVSIQALIHLSIMLTLYDEKTHVRMCVRVRDVTCNTHRVFHCSVPHNETKSGRVLAVFLGTKYRFWSERMVGAYWLEFSDKQVMGTFPNYWRFLNILIEG